MNATRIAWLVAAFCSALLMSFLPTLNQVVQAADDPAEFTLQPPSVAEPMGPKALFQAVSPAVAYVETPRGSGSGVFVEPGYLVTNAHVVWPYESVRVVFPDGTEIQDVPLVAWDLMADLAILGPLDVDVEPVNFVDGSDLEIGSTVYLIGYPGETEEFPQPTIADGLLSRVRNWESIDLALLQVDAAVTGGHSGGVLVTETGDVIGLTTQYFTDAQYALDTSAADIVPRLNALLQGQTDAFDDRHPLQQEAATEVTATLEDADARDYYFMDVEPGSDVEISIEGAGRPSVAIFDLYGAPLAESAGQDERLQKLSVNVEEAVGPYIVMVGQSSPYRNSYTLTSSQGVIAGDDPEDGATLSVGDVYTGSIDTPGDGDTFKLKLHKGDKVVIEVDSFMADTLLVLLYQSYLHNEMTGARDGAGPFRSNPRIVYEAPATDDYTLIVGSESDLDIGGYILSVTEADADEQPTELYQDQSFFVSPYGLMAQYESERYGYTAKYPALWSVSECPEGAEMTACFSGANGALFVAEEDLSVLPSDYRSRTAYVDATEKVLGSSLAGGELVARSEFTSPQGYTVDLLHFTGQGGLATLLRFIYVNEAEEWAANLTLVTSTDNYDDLERTLDYVLSTFRLWDEQADLKEDPIYHLDEGIRLASEQQNLAAIGELGQAIKRDPTLLDAFLIRNVVYNGMGQFKLAAADLEKALALQPDDAKLYTQLGLALWYAGEALPALEATDQAIALDPELISAYNNRALMRASTGDYASALEDMAQIEELEGELAPFALDSRAYIYLKMEDYEAARGDYEELLADDFQSPVTLLGAGVTYARTDELEKAMPLLEYGMELYARAKVEHPDPQMAEVVVWANEILAETEDAE